MKKNQLVTKITMDADIYCYFGDSQSEVKISQSFYSENTDSESLLNELMYFIKRGTFTPFKKLDNQMVTDLDVYYIYFESFWNYEEVSDFYEKLSIQLYDLLAFDIKCSDEILKGLTEEQREDLGDGGWSIFLKKNPKFSIVNPKK